MASKKFRIYTKNLFLTYPQTSYPLEDFKANCLKLFEPQVIEKLLISTEKHQDGNDHIHAVICLQKQVQTTRQNYFDGLVQPPRHPNIVSRFRGGLAKTLSYVMKDGNWISHPEDFNPTTLIQKSSNKKEIKKTDAIAHRMEKGETIEDLLQDEAGFCSDASRKAPRVLGLPRRQRPPNIACGGPLAGRPCASCSWAYEFIRNGACIMVESEPEESSFTEEEEAALAEGSSAAWEDNPDY